MQKTALCLYHTLWDFYSNTVVSYLHWMSASIHTCVICIPSLLCHTYISLDFVCIILCEIFFASMSATWGFVVKGFFTTGFDSGHLRFAHNFYANTVLYHPLWDFYSNTVVSYIQISALCLYHPLWDFYSNTVVSYLIFCFQTGLAFCRLRIYERMFSGNFTKR